MYVLTCICCNSRRSKSSVDLDKDKDFSNVKVNNLESEFGLAIKSFWMRLKGSARKRLEEDRRYAYVRERTDDRR
jgi:hypothetical protein